MLGINFKGRYNRRKYWSMTLLCGLLCLMVNIPLVPIISKIEEHEIQIKIAKTIYTKKGSVAHEDIEKVKAQVERTQYSHPGTKAIIEENIADMEKMSKQELENVSKEGFPVLLLPLGIFILILNLYFSLLAFSFYVKRAHDLNKSGWFVFLMSLVPVANLFYILYIVLAKGHPGDNSYGQPPV